MKKLILPLGLITALLSTVCQGGEMTVYGLGGDSCGQWVAQRKGKDWFTMGHWMLGYITAVQDETDRPLKKTDSQAMAVWMDNYCQKYPLNDFIDGVRALVDELTVPS